MKYLDYQTIIARLESRKYYRDKPLPVFDIYKDFLGLNRALRKQIASGKKQEFESIDVNEDYIGLELLAIYWLFVKFSISFLNCSYLWTVSYMTSQRLRIYSYATWYGIHTLSLKFSKAANKDFQKS